MAVVVGGGTRGAWQTGGFVHDGAGSATLSQLRQEQRDKMLNVVFGAVDSS